MNQYDFTRPVRDHAMFFGRRALRQEILEGVRQGASFAIIGGTRLGKTSLLFQVRQALLEQNCLRSRAESLVELLEMKILLARTPGLSNVAH